MNLADLLFAPRYEIGPEEVVVHAGDEEITHAELVARARAVADTLHAEGLQSGALVAVMLGNDAETVATMFGVWHAGCVYMPLNPRSTDDELARLTSAVPVAGAVTTDEDAARVPYDRAAQRYDSDVALVQMTSGTTGPPKPVVLTHTAVLGLMDKVLGSLGAETKRSSTPNLIPVSLSLWAGIYNTCFAFRVGAPVVLMDRFDPQSFATLVARHNVKSVVLPPAAMVMLADDERVTSLEPLRWVRSITAPLSPFQARRFHDRFGTGILNSYGQTELGGEIVGWSAADWRAFGDTKLGAAGRPHDGVEVRVVDDELWVRTPSIAGYADGATTMADRITDDGWFRTGDLGHVDDDGFVWIDGRVSDQINRGGMKITPGEVEEVLRAAPGVLDAAVVGVADDRLGEVPVAFLVAEDPTTTLDAVALEEHCRAHVAPWKVPIRFQQVDTLPRNEVGKLLRRELMEQA